MWNWNRVTILPMDDAQSPLETRQKIRDLLGRATLQRVRGQPAQALQLAQ